MSDSRRPVDHRINRLIAEAIQADEHQVQAATGLLDGGATVPFISRYRKEVTGGLTDTQLRLLEERLSYLRELDDRRQAILASIEEQGKLDAALRARIDDVQTKAELEDLYLPFRRKRRTKGQIAIEAGLEPLADLLWHSPENDPALAVGPYLTAPSVEGDDVAACLKDAKSALEGARYILMERFADDASLIARVRELLQNQGYMCAAMVKGQEREGAKFQDYFDHQEPLARVPGHRALAMFRGRAEGILSLSLQLKDNEGYSDDACISLVGSHLGFRHMNLPADDWRAQVVSWTWKV